MQEQIPLSEVMSPEIVEKPAEAKAAPREEAAETSTADVAPAKASEDDIDGETQVDRRALEAQLEALKRKESELRRALAIADHPELADAIRIIEGRAYAVTRVEAKIAAGLSKSEERKRETLEKKLVSLQEKRADLDAQIAEVKEQLAPLGQARLEAFEAERRAAVQELIVVMSQHDDALRSAQLEMAQLVPEIARLMPEIMQLAESLSGPKSPRAS